jgi:hypothetical protein
MRYAILILSTVLICTACSAGEMLAQKKGQAVSEETGTDAGAPVLSYLKIVQNGFQLNWTLSPQDPGTVTGYEIVRADRFTGPYAQVATVEKGTSQYIDTTASPETIYFYKVRAVVGSGFSPFSNPVSGERSK